MGIKLNGEKFGKGVMICGALALGFYAVVSLKGCVDENQQANQAQQQADEQKAATEQSNSLWAQADDALRTQVENGTTYGITGSNTAYMSEGDVVYRFNFALNVMVVRHLVDPKEGAASVTPFSQLDSAEIPARIKAKGCNIAATARARFTQMNKDGMNGDAIAALENTLAGELKSFQHNYCL